MSRKLQIVTVVLFVTVLFAFSIGFILTPDQSFSEQENRSLRSFPKFTWKKLASGAFGDEINDYFADQFPLRDALVGLKGYSENTLGKGENNGVILGKDGQLQTRLFDMLWADGSIVKDTDVYDPATVQKALDGINRAEDSLEIPFSVLLTGRVIDVSVSASDYPAQFSDALLTQLREGMGDGVDYIETVPMFREKYDAGEYVYYKTDHHWTTLGAYYAYVETLKSFGMEDEILPMDAFERETVSKCFYGTAWSAGGMKFVPPDQIEHWTLGNESEFSITADGRELSGFYSDSYLEKKDQYSFFLDGTHDVVTIKKEGEERPTLLILKDSFANSMAPFLAQHFDLVLLNLSSRKDFTNVTAFAEEYEADRALIVYTVENVVTADKLSKLR
ncbi:MAG: hypothetical protein IJX19_06945 [Clostridia bacterium]|nr:hypothetical protein [Clostridia bacterium]